MFSNCLWFIEQAWETVFKFFTMKICEVIWIFINYLWKTGSWKSKKINVPEFIYLYGILAYIFRQHLGNELFWLYVFLVEEEQKAALCSTLAEILEQACSTSSTTSFCLVTWAKGQCPHTTTHTPLTGGPETSQQPSESHYSSIH